MSVFCMCVRHKTAAGKKEIEMKQSSPYVKSDWNILGISRHLAYIIWEASERQSSLAAGTVESKMQRCELSPIQ